MVDMVRLILVIDGWDRGSHPMKKNEFGVWEIVVPAKNGQPAIPHNSKIKVRPVHPLRAYHSCIPLVHSTRAYLSCICTALHRMHTAWLSFADIVGL